MANVPAIVLVKLYPILQQQDKCCCLVLSMFIDLISHHNPTKRWKGEISERIITKGETSFHPGNGNIDRKFDIGVYFDFQLSPYLLVYLPHGLYIVNRTEQTHPPNCYLVKSKEMCPLHLPVKDPPTLQMNHRHALDFLCLSLPLPQPMFPSRWKPRYLTRK